MLAAIKTIETGTREEILRHISVAETFEHDSDNNTLLHYACLAGNLNAVNILLERGYYVNANNVDGQTPICDAAANGSAEIIRALIRFGANVNPPAYWGSPLMFAVKNGHYEALVALIEAGADVNACDRKGFCPLHVAVRKQFYEAVECLLMAGADPNKCCKLITPLHLAAELRNEQMVRQLLLHGAYPSPVDAEGKKPIDYVQKGSYLHNLISAYTGSSEVFTQLIGARGKDVLYTGDHIFGDIMRSKKKVGWRTFLVIPELTNEIYVWKKKKELFDRLQYLDNKLADAYKDMNIETKEQPDVANLRNEIKSVAAEMERSYGLLGSIFRSGSRHTFFSSQAMRYADIYSFSCFNLLHYPLCYMFRAPTMLMPHESTVPHSDSPIGSFANLDETPCGLRRRSYAITLTNASFVQPEKLLISKGIKNSNLVTEEKEDGSGPLLDTAEVE